MISRAVELSNVVKCFYLKGSGPVMKVDYFGLICETQVISNTKLLILKWLAGLSCHKDVERELFALK